MLMLSCFYRDSDPVRRAEILECLRKNLLNEEIGEVHVLVEDDSDPLQLLGSLPKDAESKVRVVAKGTRQTFQQLFQYANTQPPGQPVILANADIYFDESLRRLRGLPLASQFLCLTRWDVQRDGSAQLFDHPASQDAWIFQTPIRTFSCNFPMGVPACDNRLAWEAERAGLVLSNPSRSIRAFHLHLSGIRRYTERSRVPGASRGISSTPLNASWLWFVVPRLDDSLPQRQSAPSLDPQLPASCMIVGHMSDAERTDASRSRATRWNFVPPSRVGRAASQLWNSGVGALDDNTIVCCMHGSSVAPGFAEHLLSHWDPGDFLVPEEIEDKRFSAVIFGKKAFASVGGFDEAIDDAERACADLGAALERGGYRKVRIGAEFLARGISEESSRLSALDTGHGPAAAPQVREPLAAISFQESMGLTVRRLRVGTSSHNNDPRPIEAAPVCLLGRAFTQVVANIVSPVSVQFLTAGKMYVLAGTDWDGYHCAAAWLAKKGHREDLPQVTTARGTAFEIWSLAGTAGQKFVIPTQVGLVADRLQRM
jgi:hypothetical protein